ncbi:MAG: hypothetical protein ACM3P1_11970, partial [Candidatus Saccharibacteria bacterium]
MQTKQARIFKIAAITLLSLIVLVTGILYFRTQAYLNNHLSGYVSKKSKGKYELNFDNLQINFSQWGFEINNVKFHPTDSVVATINDNDSISGRRLYTFSSPTIYFSNIKILKLLFGHQLDIGEIAITQPELKIHGKQ